jgi:RNA polymerase sigma-70 factor, ECF subfamily
MERYADGDTSAFESLYRELKAPLQRRLRYWLKADEKVDDAFQLTWVKIHRSRALYRQGALVLPWVLTIARNVALDHLRSKAARELSLHPEAAERIPDVAPPRWEAEDTAEVVEAVREAIAQLPPAAREVIRLHKLEERPMAEVAELLGITEGAARVRAHRGYKALARILLGFRERRS